MLRSDTSHARELLNHLSYVDSFNLTFNTF